MAPRTASERGRQVRQNLLAAAVELIPEVGWSAVSTRLLAERAGVAPGLVHYHFSSLRALLADAVVGAMREVLVSVRPLLERAEGVDDGIDAVVGELDTYTGRDPTSLLFVEAALAATRDERMRDELAGLIDEIREYFADWLRRLGHDTPQDTAAVLAASIDGVMLHRALKPDMTSAVAGPALRRLVTPAGDSRDPD